MEDFRLNVSRGDDSLRKSLETASLLSAAKRDGVTDPVDIFAAARADYARLVGALYAEGYFGGTVRILIDGREAASIDPLRRPETIRQVVAEVDPGRIYQFREPFIGPLAHGTKLPKDFEDGKTARTREIQAAVSASVSAWRDVGHAKARVGSQKIVANHGNKKLIARIVMDPGPKLRFGDLRITGTSSVKEYRIHQIAGLPSGEVFSPAALDRTGKRLRDTGVFKSAAVTEAENPNSDGTLDITAQLEDRKPRRFGFGAQYGTDDGVTLSAFWLHRNLFREALRFRIGGEVSGLAGNTGGEDYKVTLDLERPATFGTKTDAYFKGEIERLDEPDFTSDTLRLTFGARRRHTDTLTLQAAVRLALSDETDASGSRTYRQVYFPFGAILDKRDSPLDTIDGYYVSAEVAPFFGFGGSANGTRIEADARWYEDFGADSRFVFATRVQFGSILGADVTGVPNDLRFHSGGGGTVRGQGYQALGITLPGGVSSGGRSFFGVQSELRTKVTDTISVVGFYDWGTVGTDSWPGASAESHSGAGLGVRYNTGIGPIRLDVGVPVSGPSTGDKFQIYIGIGQAF